MCHGSFLLWAFPDCNAALPNLLKNCEIQSEFSRVKKSEDLTEGFNLSRGNGKLSDPTLHYLRFRFGYSEPPGLFLAALCAADVMILGHPIFSVNRMYRI